MMKWTRQYSLITGVALILLTNLIVLLGVAYNHSGTPDSVLRLSQRELEVPYSWRLNNENSGQALKLNWRTHAAVTSYASREENERNWLDKDKLASLGFNVSASIHEVRERMIFQKQLCKQVYLVMEFDGPAYRQAIEIARKMEADEVRKKYEVTTLALEQNSRSRLFVVDAGLNRELLRARFPDTNHYSIVRGKVCPAIYSQAGQPSMTGYIQSISPDYINVPLQFRDLFGPMQQTIQPYRYRKERDQPLHFEATVAFGRRLEPWLVAASAK